MDFIEKIFNAGIVGAGGAGFPTHIKLNCNVKYLIVNGAECEPLLETDKFLMRTKSTEIIRAMDEVGRMIEAEKLIISLKSKYKNEIKHLENAIKELNSNVELFLLENFYPAGDEQILVYEITGKSVPEGGIPLDVNSVVSNVGTLVNIFEAINGNPVIEKYITLIGEINNPGILKVPIGISIKECIEAAGGSSLNDFSVIIGGPMMGRIVHKAEIENEFITKIMGSLILVPSDHYIVKRAQTPIKHIINQAKTACIQCSMCTELCPRYLIGHKLRPHRLMRSLGMSENEEEILKEALICCECGICELYACPMGLSPRIVNKYIKEQLRNKKLRYQRDGNDITAKEIREYRKIPVSRLISRLNLKKYQHKNMEKALEVKASRVVINLRQHIGVSANPIVAIGDRVLRGQMIAKVSMEELGANIHSSIDGVVCKISDSVVIQRIDNEVIL